MCLLNGDLGGSFNATIDFGTEDIIENTYTPIAIENPRAYTSHTYYINWYFPYYGPFNQKDAEAGEYYIRSNSTPYTYSSDNTKNLTQFEAGTTYYTRRYGLASEQYNIRDGQDVSLSSDKKLVYFNQIKTVTKKKIPVKKIIKELVHVWGNEPYENIIINDLDTYGLEQLTYHGEEPLYCLRPVDSTIYEQMHIGGDELLCYRLTDDDKQLVRLDGIIHNFPTNERVEQSLSDILADTKHPFSFASPAQYNATQNYSWIGIKVDENSIKPFIVLCLSTGDDAGYHAIDLVYPNDLIAKPGEACTSILDKIKQMLGDYEYFYNLDGQFVFQKQRTYIKTQWAPLSGSVNDLKISPLDASSPNTYNFEGNKLLTALTNTPSLTSLKNDFTIWGVRKTAASVDVDIHMRYAIDKKPVMYRSFDGILYGSSALKNERITEHKIYEKRPVPEWLAATEDPAIPTASWWYLTDWAEYYKLLTKSNNNPPGMLFHYGSGQKGFTGDITFPNGETVSLQNALIFDYNTAEGSPYYNDNWEPFQHGFGTCLHTFEDFLAFQRNKPNFVSFIFDPHIPTDSITAQYVSTYLPGGIISLEDEGETISADAIVDWREIIYQMALDYFKYGERPDFLKIIAKNNRAFYPTGYTGYEQYYTDLQGFWRQLYNPYAELKIQYQNGAYYEARKIKDPSTGQYEVTSDNWSLPEITDVNSDYYLALGSESGLPSDENGQLIKIEIEKYEDRTPGEAVPADCLIRNSEVCEMIKQKTTAENGTIYLDANDERVFWNRNVFEAPETLNFWFDFIDATGDFSAVSVPAIGSRTKVVNDNKVKSMYYKEVPNFIYYTSTTFDLDKYRDKAGGYVFVILPEEMDQLFSISYRGKAATDEMDQLIYDYGYGTESISITALPIYHLEPNTRILVHDKKSGINGIYLIKKITLPLDYKGMMTIQATKLPTAKPEDTGEGDQEEFVGAIKQFYDGTDIDFLSKDMDLADEINEQFINAQENQSTFENFSSTFAHQLWNVDPIIIGDFSNELKATILQDLKIIPIHTASIALDEKVKTVLNSIYVQMIHDPTIVLHLSSDLITKLEDIDTLETYSVKVQNVSN